MSRALVLSSGCPVRPGFGLPGRGAGPWGSCRGPRERLRSAGLNPNLITRLAPIRVRAGLLKESASPMATVVMKFGGTSVANIERIQNVARHVKREVDAGNKVAVVVSAMSGVTNQLVAWVKDASPLYDAREYDAVVATGEQVTAGLLAITLQGMGLRARSWTGWQVPIKTNAAHGTARITEIPGAQIKKAIEGGEIAVVTGFQGIEPLEKRISTLGRGGSDTSAVAIAVALEADVCDIYTDVDGVYTTDPRIVPKARRLAKISYEEMLEMASLGSKVLQTRSVELAMVYKVRTRVLSSFVAPDGMKAFSPDNIEDIGTIVCDEDEIVEQQVVSGIAYAKDEAKVTLLKVDDKPGVAARIFGPLADANINVDMIVQNVGADGKHTDMTFTVQAAELTRAIDVLKKAKADIGHFDIKSSADIVKISVIGVGMRSHAGVAAQMFKVLSEKGINIHAISTSEIKVSVLIEAAYAELAVRALHSAYGLDND
ncbi:aspartate kinase [Hyphomicrobium facile]|uniref:Aspartokinase n=2 Tax=Hyphomicrobium facile TaxID=51670 RepID=A0A1I7NUD3_9HYPH|nr:aspartate kinase [Hyphomicrobium facile]